MRSDIPGPGREREAAIQKRLRQVPGGAEGKGNRRPPPAWPGAGRSCPEGQLRRLGGRLAAAEGAGTHHLPPDGQLPAGREALEGGAPGLRNRSGPGGRY